MLRNMTPSPAGFPRTLVWSLELEVELCAAGGCEPTAEQLRMLAAMLTDVEGIGEASAEAHGPPNLVRLRLIVDAHDQHDALDRVSAPVRDRVSAAGLGPAILVAAHAGSSERTMGRRMG